MEFHPPVVEDPVPSVSINVPIAVPYNPTSAHTPSLPPSSLLPPSVGPPLSSVDPSPVSVDPPVTSVTSPKAPRTAPLVSLVSAAAFSTILCEKGTTIQFTLRAQVTDASGHSSTTVAAPDLSGIPEDYHEFADIFSERDSFNLPPHREYNLKIETEGNALPPIGPLYSLSQAESIALRKFLDENICSGFIYPSKSSHGAPILFAKKKDGSLHLCVDYRGLNRLPKKDRYPLPLITDLLDAPAKARIYTKLDLRHAYHLLRVAEGDEYKTAFRSRYGSYEWRVVPEGLTNAPAAFQRFVNSIFADMLDVCIIVYLDDVLVYSKNPADHRKNVKEVLRRLRKNSLYCKLSKCEFDVTTTEYLGYILSPEGLRMSSEKVQVIQDWPIPRKVKDVQSFLGFCNFYRRFIPSYSDLTIPLTRLTRANIRWDWNTSCQSTFAALKEAFTSAQILHHWVPGQQLTVETDASDYAIASILSITDKEGKIRPVAFRSRSLSPAELNYDVHDKELLAIYDAFSAWRHYLEGSPLTIDVVTDHKNLEYFATTKILTRRWDVYAKEEEGTYAKANPHNFRPIFTQEQIQASLRATLLEEPALRASHVMDTTALHKDIRTSLRSDPEALKGIELAMSPSPGRWALDGSGLLRLDKHIYVPRPDGTSDSLRICVLQNHHDHILAGHFGQNHTLEIRVVITGVDSGRVERLEATVDKLRRDLEETRFRVDAVEENAERLKERVDLVDEEVRVTRRVVAQQRHQASDADRQLERIRDLLEAQVTASAPVDRGRIRDMTVRHLQTPADGEDDEAADPTFDPENPRSERRVQRLMPGQFREAPEDAAYVSDTEASEYEDDSEVDPVDVELGELSEADGPARLAGVFGRYGRYPVLGEPTNEEQVTSSDESGSEGGEVVSAEAGAEVGVEVGAEEGAEVADGEEGSSEDEDDEEEGGEEEGSEEGEESGDGDDEEEDGSGED
ncbi:hypothetical protein EUX98_g8392 [Antrodiella citrinella]|uniref:Reverse transcriptase domain-containing protein n=1 Tax=Antrodiella citrinella TaxID=2447956 RepID=A0A4S4M9D6_9APHY|nr:hypothetical protein EUX98_g8392 [Antrodiella citrinella]